MYDNSFDYQAFLRLEEDRKNRRGRIADAPGTVVAILNKMRGRLSQDVSNVVSNTTLLLYLNDANRWLWRKISTYLPQILLREVPVTFDEHQNIVLPPHCLKVIDVYFYRGGERHSLHAANYTFELISEKLVRIRPKVGNAGVTFYLTYNLECAELLLSDSATDWSPDFNELLERYAVVLYKKSRGLDFDADMADVNSIWDEMRDLLAQPVPMASQLEAEDENEYRCCRSNYGWR